MNILYHCSEYPPYRNGGGIGTVTKIVAEEMSRRGHNVYVTGYYINQVEHEKVEVINDVTVLRFNLGSRRKWIQKKTARILNRLHLAGKMIQRELDWYESKVADLIRVYKIDLLEYPDYYEFNNTKAQLSFHRFGIPTVLRVHGSLSFVYHHSGEEQPYVLKNDRNHFARANYLCSVSKYAESYVVDDFSGLKFTEKKIIYNPIESLFLKHNKPSNSKVVLYIGRLIKTKGAFVVAEAFSRVLPEFPEWNLHMCGGGNIEAIRATLSEKAKKSIVFLGFCNREKIATEIDNCVTACIPTYFENFSMVPLEIMGRTRSVIFTSRTSGNEVVTDGVDGFTVDPENVNEVCQKLKELMRNEELRNIMAERGYEKVKNRFCEKEICAELETFYKGCIESYNH